MTRPAWVAIAGIAGCWLFEWTREPLESNTIEFPYQDQPVVVRISDRAVSFPVLGAKVTLGSDWVYLSTTNPALSDHPTFLNARDQAVVTLVPAWASNLEAIEQPTPDQTGRRRSLVWLPAAPLQQRLVVEIMGVAFPIRWTDRPRPRIGRWQQGPLDLVVIVYSEDPNADAAVEQFLAEIESEHAM